MGHFGSMWLWIPILFGLALLPGSPAATTSSGTLILVGATKTSIVLASDSLVVQSLAGLPTKTRKITPVGNTAACFMSGSTSFRWADGNKITDAVDFRGAMEGWIRAHPNAQASYAYDSISVEVLEMMKAMQRKHAFVDDSSRPFLSFACVGYTIGLPMMYFRDYEAPTTQEITTHGNPHPLPPGFFVAIGKDAVCDEITQKNATPALSGFKLSPAVMKYAEAKRYSKVAALATKDLLMMSRVCLEATEGTEGRAFDPDAKFVGPPNRYAVIDASRGFAWADLPPTHY